MSKHANSTASRAVPMTMAVLASIVGLFGLTVTAAGVTMAYGFAGLAFVGLLVAVILTAAIASALKRHRHRPAR